MWKPIYDPGPWKAFLGRKDIKGLPIMEAKKKYVEEQLLFESYLNTLNTVNTVNTVSPASAGVAGGQRKFKYAAQYKLTYRGTGDTPLKAGVYDRVAISDLKRYWVDNGLNKIIKIGIPLPQIPSNIGSDYFFIHVNASGISITVSLITWGSLGRGRQRGQWTYSEYNLNLGLPTRTCNEYYNTWINGFGFGSSDLSTPAGKWKINSFESNEQMECITTSYPYELTEVKPVKPGTLPETIDFAREDGTTDTYTGTYSRDGVDGNGNPVWRQGEDPGDPSIYYSTDCGGWKVDSGGNRLNCSLRIKAGSAVVEGPLGTYTATADTKPPSTIIYTATAQN